MLHHERRGAGPPLLLVHGLGGDALVWEPVLDALAAHCDVIAVDLPGFGRSPVLDGGREPTPAAMAAEVAALLDALGLDRVAVAGNSLGAWVALELARERRATCVAGIAPAGFWDRPLGPRSRPGPHALPAAVRRVLPYAAVLPGARRLVLAGVVAHPERVPRAAALRIVRAYLAAPGFAAANAAMRADHIRYGDVAELGIPVVLAWAQEDRLVAEPRGGVPGARAELIPDAGHLAMWDQPAQVARIVLACAAGPAPAVSEAID